MSFGPLGDFSRYLLLPKGIYFRFSLASLPKEPRRRRSSAVAPYERRRRRHDAKEKGSVLFFDYPSAEARSQVADICLLNTSIWCLFFESWSTQWASVRTEERSSSATIVCTGKSEKTRANKSYKLRTPHTPGPGEFRLRMSLVGRLPKKKKEKRKTRDRLVPHLGYLIFM